MLVAIKMRCIFPTIGSIRMFQRSPTMPSPIHLFRNRQHGNKSPFGQRNKIQTPTPPSLNAEANTGLLKPIVFAVGFSTGALIAVAIWEYETARARIARKLDVSPFKWLKNKPATTSTDMKQWWSTLLDEERILFIICTLNAIVYLLWRVPKFNPMMMQYFSSSPTSKSVCLPMLLSTFSHFSLMHLVVNMFVLSNFIQPVIRVLGKEQFVGVYLSAGVISSLTSHMMKVAVGGVSAPSLGASGAIMAVVAIFCAHYPDTQLSLVFMPFFTFPASSAMVAAMSLDATGCVLGWKFFDHAAHLGGAAFGLAWYYLGREYIWKRRISIQKEWHKLRES